jgi:AcrR family transcriptional regulator
LSRIREKPTSDRRGALLMAATRLFVERGFAGTTTDEIAKRAGSSKATIYHHFRSKLGLFDAVVRHLTAGLSAGLLYPVAEGTLHEALTAFGTNYLRLILHPDALGIFRVVIGEGSKLPGLGRVLHQHASVMACAFFVDYLRCLEAKGLVRIDDMEGAGEQFLASLCNDLHLRALLSQPLPTGAEIDSAVAHAVRLFTRCFGTVRAASPTGLKESSVKNPPGG